MYDDKVYMMENSESIMTKIRKKSREINCISDRINVVNKHVFEKECGNMPTYALVDCTLDCIKRNQVTGSSRKTCNIKCKSGKKSV